MKRVALVSILYILMAAFNSHLYGKISNLPNRTSLFKNGYDFFLNKKYDLAIKTFTQYINEFPNDNNIVLSYYYLGESYYNKQEYEKAIKIYKKTINDFQLSETLIRKISFSLAYAYIGLNDLDKAIDEFAHITSNYPFTSEGLLSQLKIGDCFYDKSDYDQAADVYNKVYNKIIQNKETSSSGPEIGNRLGSALFKTKKFDESIKTYEDIISRYPEWKNISSIKINLSIVYFYTRNISKARSILKEITNLAATQIKDSAEAYYWLGYIAYTEKSYEEALINFEKTLSFFPKHRNDLTYNTNLAIACVYNKLKKGTAAEEILNSLITLPVERNVVPAAYYTLGTIYENQGKTIKAINTYSKVLETASNTNSIEERRAWEKWYQISMDQYQSLIKKSQEEEYLASSLFIIAESYYKMQYYNQAEYIYIDITKKFPNNAFELEAWLKLSYIYKIQNKKDKIDEICSYVKYNYPQQIEYLNKIKISLAEVYFNNNSYDSSSNICKQILDTAKKNDDSKANAYYIRGKIFLKQGYNDKASNYFLEIAKSFPSSNWAQRSLYELAWICINKNDYNSAINFFAKLQEDFSYFKTEYIAMHLADLYYATKQYRFAIEQYIFLLERPSFSSARDHCLFWLAWSYIGEKDYENAKNIFYLFLDSNPTAKFKPFIYLTIADCLRYPGNFSEASYLYIKIIKNYPETNYAKTARENFEKAFEQNNAISIDLNPIKIEGYEDTWTKQKTISSYSVDYISESFPFDSMEWFLLKFRNPEITYLSCDKDGILKKDDELTVTLRGSAGIKAFFDIGSFKKNIPMEELSSGVYRGSYKIKLEDSVNEAGIISYLSNYDNLKTYQEFTSKISIKKIAQSNIYAPIDMGVQIIEIDKMPENLIRPATDLKIFVLPTGDIEYIDITKTSGDKILDQIGINKIIETEKYNPVNSKSPDTSLRIYNIRVVFVLKQKK
ncbi:tetratricopeptide repeat protein [Candidatus Poribacteria bacterium]|nr:tetratricopeptide repeat protein [Candidatus Poribacteria bacterium]